MPDGFVWLIDRGRLMGDPLIARWAKYHLQSNSTVISDGLPCFSAVNTPAAIISVL